MTLQPKVTASDGLQPSVMLNLKSGQIKVWTAPKLPEESTMVVLGVIGLLQLEVGLDIPPHTYTHTHRQTRTYVHCALPP